MAHLPANREQAARAAGDWIEPRAFDPPRVAKSRAVSRQEWRLIADRYGVLMANYCMAVEASGGPRAAFLAEAIAHAPR